MSKCYLRDSSGQRIERHQGWVFADDIRNGQQVRTTSTTDARIVQTKAVAKWDTVYNFEVAGTHTYFVAPSADDLDFGLWVHNNNKTGGKTPNASGGGNRPKISRQKQDGHIDGTPQNKNRSKNPNKATSVFDETNKDAVDKIVREAWDKGTPVPGRPGIRDYDTGKPIGTLPDGRRTSIVRVHEDSKGVIHGHPGNP